MNTQRAAMLLRTAAEYIAEVDVTPWPIVVYDGAEQTPMGLAMDLERAAVELEADDPDDDGKCSCGKDGKAPHPCPYQQEINDSEMPCNCCAECRYQCAMDI